MSFYGASLVPGGIHSISKSERERIKDYAIQGQIHNPKKCRRPNAWNQFIHEYWRDHKDEYKNLADGKYIKDGLNMLFQDASNEYKALTPVQKQEYARKAREHHKGGPLRPPFAPPRQRRERKERKEEKEGKNTPPPSPSGLSPEIFPGEPLYQEFIQETEDEKKLEEEGVVGVSPEARYEELLNQALTQEAQEAKDEEEAILIPLPPPPIRQPRVRQNRKRQRQPSVGPLPQFDFQEEVNQDEEEGVEGVSPPIVLRRRRPRHRIISDEDDRRRAREAREAKRLGNYLPLGNIDLQEQEEAEEDDAEAFHPERGETLEFDRLRRLV